jgi:hypothetical protein
MSACLPLFQGERWQGFYAAEFEIVALVSYVDCGVQGEPIADGARAKSAMRIQLTNIMVPDCAWGTLGCHDES